MVLLLKAREASPKRGYFWRSWMTVVGLVAMGKDLELDDHYENHQMGKSCGSTQHECITKTRVWQTLFMLEIMVGGPQGKQRCLSTSLPAYTPQDGPILESTSTPLTLTCQDHPLGWTPPNTRFPASSLSTSESSRMSSKQL